MENNSGWIKLHRKVFNNPYMSNPSYFSVWIWILVHAEHGMKLSNGIWINKEEDEMPSVIWKGERRYLRRGEFSFGEIRIAKETGVPRGTVHRILLLFKNEHQIELLRGNKFSLGLVLNWSKYQQNEGQVEQQVNIQRTSSEHVTKNNKKIKKREGKNPSLLFIEKFNALFGIKFRVTPNVVKLTKLRLKTFSLDELLLAVENLSKSEFHRGKNDRGWVADPKFLLRDDDQINKWVNTVPVKRGLDYSRTDNVF